MLMQHAPARLLDAILRSDIVAFTQRAFAELHPNKQMIAGWHHEAIAYWLDVTALRQEYDRLIINLPPRSLKSEMVSVAFLLSSWGVIPRAR